MKSGSGIIAKTGETCPCKGIWKILEAPSVAIMIEEGNLIPPYMGRSVSWELIRTQHSENAPQPDLSFYQEG